MGLLVARSPVTETKWEARGIGWLGAGCTPPQRGHPGAKAEQASLLHVLSRSSLSLCRPPEGWLRCRAPHLPTVTLPPGPRVTAIAFSPLSGCSLELLAWVFLYSD